jgi:hypothetical protein
MNWVMKLERIDEAGNLQSAIVGHVQLLESAKVGYPT